MALNIDTFATAYNWLSKGGDDQCRFDYNNWRGRDGCGTTACIGGYIEQVVYFPDVGSRDLDTPEGAKWLGITEGQMVALFFGEGSDAHGLDVDWDMNAAEASVFLLETLDGWYPGSAEQIKARAAELESQAAEELEPA